MKQQWCNLHKYFILDVNGVESQMEQWGFPDWSRIYIILYILNKVKAITVEILSAQIDSRDLVVLYFFSAKQFPPLFCI